MSGGVEECVLQDVGGVDPALKSCIHAQLDHSAQSISVALEQVRERLSVALAEPLLEMDGIARIIRHNSPHILLHAHRRDSGTRLVSFWFPGQLLESRGYLTNLLTFSAGSGMQSP